MYISIRRKSQDAENQCWTRMRIWIWGQLWSFIIRWIHWWTWWTHHWIIHSWEINGLTRTSGNIRGGTSCLGGVSTPCRPVAPRMPYFKRKISVSKSVNGTIRRKNLGNTDPWKHQRWDHLPRRRKHFLPTSHPPWIQFHNHKCMEHQISIKSNDWRYHHLN